MTWNIYGTIFFRLKNVKNVKVDDLPLKQRSGGEGPFHTWLRLMNQILSTGDASTAVYCKLLLPP